MDFIRTKKKPESVRKMFFCSNIHMLSFVRSHRKMVDEEKRDYFLSVNGLTIKSKFLICIKLAAYYVGYFIECKVWKHVV